MQPRTGDISSTWELQILAVLAACTARICSYCHLHYSETLGMGLGICFNQPGSQPQVWPHDPTWYSRLFVVPPHRADSYPANRKEKCDNLRHHRKPPHSLLSLGALAPGKQLPYFEVLKQPYGLGWQDIPF